MTEKVQYPQAERQRLLQSLAFAENTILSRDLPRDTVLKGINLRLSGGVTTTFASGTPVSNADGAFDNLIPRIDIVVNGSRVVKSVRPVMLRMQQLFHSGTIGERKASAGAALATGGLPTVDGGFVYGTTTQITTVAETLYLPFEMIYADTGLGRERTWLNLKGVASAELRLTCAAGAALLGFGNTAPVVYSAYTMLVEISTIEAQDVPPNVIFSDWKQTTKDILFSAQTTDSPIDINRGNKLAGIFLYCRDGAAGSTTTATGKVPSNLALTTVNLKINGQTDIKKTSFLSLQSENRALYGLNVPLASNISILDGFARMEMLARRDLSTALDLRPPLVDNAQLVVNTNTSANVSYTNPVTVTVMTEEVVEPR